MFREGLNGGSAMTEYVTAAAAAERLGVSRITVWRWVRDGRFEVVRRKGLSKNSANLIPVDSVPCDFVIPLGSDVAYVFNAGDETIALILAAAG